mgnify:CR=1 FL=1
MDDLYNFDSICVGCQAKIQSTSMTNQKRKKGSNSYDPDEDLVMDVASSRSVDPPLLF